MYIYIYIYGVSIWLYGIYIYTIQHTSSIVDLILIAYPNC